jgi:predicted transcriptional regulator
MDFQQAGSNTREKSERFEVAFNKIHLKLKELGEGKGSDSFVDLLQQTSRKHMIIQKYFSELRQFARLRNAIVHEKIRMEYYIAEPHMEIVEQIEQICAELYEPTLAMEIASKPVVCFHPFTSIKEVLNTIEKTTFNQFPVYDSANHFHGLVTEDGVAKCLSSHISGNTISLSGLTVETILGFEKQRNVAFVNDKENVYEIEHIFEKFRRKNQKLEAVLITKDGTANDKPLGIITSWDLIKN